MATRKKRGITIMGIEGYYEDYFDERNCEEKKVYKLGNTYFNIDKITKMTKPYIAPYYRNPRGQVIKDCKFFIDDKDYTRTNFVESYSIIVNEETEKDYQEFVKEANELFNAFINQ